MSNASTTAPIPVPIDPRTFFVPARNPHSDFLYESAEVCAIVPTYAPGETTLQLVKDLLRWNEKVRIIVVDDCTPSEHQDSVVTLRRIGALSSRVTLLRTPENKLKAGALNHALRYIREHTKYVPDVVVTVDDDVVIAPETIRALVVELMSHENLGAVCSQCRVFNKNKNILTRLQGLEYLGFNAVRLSDEGFLRGPLVMHGMLTAFRREALAQAGWFAEEHLIEDYEITTRLKSIGWAVKSAQHAPAWTIVPENLRSFWRQRTRWSYGGITVIRSVRKPSAVFQDLIGHMLFLSTLGMVVALLIMEGSGVVPSFITQLIIGLSFVQLGIWYVFQLWLMRFYAEKDSYDWILRVTLLPEFMYGSAMTLALLGSYTFLLFNMLRHTIMEKGGVLATRVGEAGAKVFRILGYREGHWGTRIQ